MLPDGTTTDCETEAGDIVGNAAIGGGGIVTALAAGDAGGKHTFKRFNPAVGITYAFTPELNTYLGYNEGNRAPSPIETGCADPAFPCLLPNAMAGDPPLKQVAVSYTHLDVYKRQAPRRPWKRRYWTW